ncbi:uncharacterized zinc finger protein CG2678 [Drosophila erecta]|uniref:uncharacterized zinc finger protein CG2678 n=1 Tax=Drosophila erecta TaxID=7220 RepID=UPI000732ACEF|nr:uncharacterized zinc finger protein CG2678 [Drosophila erecta]EDV48196.2 uncharacterized protein Dere_GG14285 [Drosophila erecta]
MMKSAKNACRTCMDETAILVDIFTHVRDPALDESEMSLSHILARCTDRPVKRGDPLPQYICLPCVLAVQNAFRFKWKSEQSYQHFFRLLNQSSSPEGRLHSIASHQDENQTQKMQLKSGRQEDLQQVSKTQKSEDDLGQKHTLQAKLQENHDDGPPQTFNPHPRWRTCRTEATGDRIPKEAPRSTKIINPQVRCNANGYYKCPHCSKRFNSQTQLWTHISDLCNRCPYCPRSYKQKSNLKRHLQNHVGKPAHKCFHCSKAFMRKDHLKKHLSTHDRDGPLSCTQCSAVFIEYVQLEIHRREHLLQASSIQSESTKKPDSKDSDQAQDLKPNCTENSLKGMSSSPTTLNPKPRCHICLKKFYSIYNLKRHMLTHNLFRCEYCSLVFVDVDYLRKHKTRIHSNNLTIQEKIMSKRMASGITPGKQPLKAAH